MAAQLSILSAPGPAAVGSGERWPSFVAASLRIAATRLAAFADAMAREGIALDTSRMFFDPVYAYRRIELAQASADDELKALAAEIFDRYKALERRRRSVSAFDRPH